MKLEVVFLGVSDVDRAKAFYENLGWRLDLDLVNGDDLPDRAHLRVGFPPLLLTAERFNSRGISSRGRPTHG